MFVVSGRNLMASTNKVSILLDRDSGLHIWNLLEFCGQVAWLFEKVLHISLSRIRSKV